MNLLTPTVFCKIEKLIIMILILDIFASEYSYSLDITFKPVFFTFKFIMIFI